ncbi:hypothetical protein [Streptomyces sp. AC1-42T]|uniref:hypothetical protein n=1 Tax=Streptomyces sp. AC1-42T TaxID=2218665 RepID=UPI000DADB692|nr:hypothetical protein [Streptomyces sp. AC1-42T]PZT71409.1 hypothetical protein DNK55_32365 [Streptomyces sp. AC1-42T]
MTLAELRTQVAPRAKRVQEGVLALLFATAGLIVARTVAGIASDLGLHLGWQLGLAVAGYTLSIALLANISNTDPLKTLAAATGTLAALVYGLLRTAAAVLVLLGVMFAAVAGAFGHAVAT